MIKEPNETNRRRGFLRQVAGATAALPFTHALVATPVAPPIAAPAISLQVESTPPIVGYVCFSQTEAAFVEAMVEIMCPADELTRGGVECGLAIYIDRQLAGDFGRGSKRYARGPWQQGKPQQGYQLPMTPEQHFKAGVEAANDTCMARYGKPFPSVSNPKSIADFS